MASPPNTDLSAVGPAKADHRLVRRRPCEGGTPNTGISAVIPAFNNAGTIVEALESVAAQTCPVAETIVVDDGSTDKTAEVARACMERCALPGVVLNQANAGPAAARNRGVAAASGEWVAFLDADDAWLPWKLEAQFRGVCENPEVCVWCGPSIPFGVESPSPPSATERLCHCPVTLQELDTRNPVATSTVLVRRNLLQSVGGFDERFRGPEDYDLWLRLAARAEIRLIDAPLCRYRYSKGSLSADDRAFLPQVLSVLDKAYGPGGVLHGTAAKRRAKAYHYLACSWMAAERGALARACRLFGMSLVQWPWRFNGRWRPPWPRAKLLFCFAKSAMRGGRNAAPRDGTS